MTPPDTGSKSARFHTIDISYENLMLATGARERFLPFPGWTLPGVFGAGGLQALVHGGFSVAGKRIVVAGTGPLLLAGRRASAQMGGARHHHGGAGQPLASSRVSAHLFRVNRASCLRACNIAPLPEEPLSARLLASRCPRTENEQLERAPDRWRTHLG